MIHREYLASFKFRSLKWQQKKANCNKKSREKNAVKTRNWADDDKTLLCEILVDPMNGLVIVFNLNCLKFLIF